MNASGDGLAGIDAVSVDELGNGIVELAGIHDLFSQLDPVLPPCPITFRNNVIPVRNNRRQGADSHPKFSSNSQICGAIVLRACDLQGCPLFKKK
jgi:hypothetical protein